MLVAQARAATPPEGPRKVAVAEFGGERGKELRLALLEVLSQQGDLEVLGYRDIEVVAKRLGIGVESPADRRRISDELGIQAWFDATLDGRSASIRLMNGKGRQLAVMSIEPASIEAQAAQVREQSWIALGHHISARALREHVLRQHRQAAAQKLEARQQELAHQREVAIQREERRLERLAELRVEAQRKLADQKQEGVRQVELAQQRIAEENERRQREMEAERKAEAERQRQLAMERERAAQASMAKPSAPKFGAAPAPQPAPTAGAPPPAAGRFGDRSWMDDASPATRAWLQGRGDAGGAPSQPYAAESAPPPPSQEPAAGAGCPPTVSEATCKWLQSRRSQ